MAKRKNRQPRQKLSPLNHVLYALALAVSILLAFPSVFGVYALQDRIAAADPHALLHSYIFLHAESTELLNILPFPFGFFLPFFAVICIDIPWGHGVPLIRPRRKDGTKKKRPRFFSNPADRRKVKRYLCIAILLLILVLIPIFPRHILHEDFSVESRGVINNVTHGYTADEIDSLEIELYQHPSQRYRRVYDTCTMYLFLTMDDGRSYSFPLYDYDNGDLDLLRALCSLRDTLPTEAVTVTQNISLAEFFKQERVPEAAQPLLEELFR